MSRTAPLVVVMASLVLMPQPALAGVTPFGSGSRGGEVATWQGTLNYVLRQDRGIQGLPVAWRRFSSHRPLTVDGVFGPLTASLTRAYQYASRIPVTGRVGVGSWKAWAYSNITCCGTGYPTVGPGEWSQYVTWWQLSLDRWLANHAPGIPLLVPDGVYGPLTTAATTIYQATVGLRVDGIAGPRTWTKLFNSLAAG